MYEQVFLKEGGESRRTPWHQDSSYLAIAGDDLAVAWITFDAVSAKDSLEFVRGSHRGTLYNGSRFELGRRHGAAASRRRLPRLPDIEAERAKFDIVSFAVEPGDVVLFHPAMLHGGAPTHPGHAAAHADAALLRTQCVSTMSGRARRAARVRDIHGRRMQARRSVSRSVVFEAAAAPKD